MKTRLILIAGILAFGASLQASTATVVMTNLGGGTTQSAFPSTYGSASTVFSGAQISPYTGTLNGTTPITLFCDDFKDDISAGISYTVNVSAVNGSATNTLVTAAGMGNTRDGSANISAGYPTGTTLYEEMAWLATQMMATGRTVGDEEAIQEAIWSLSENPTTSGAPTSLVITGQTQDYSHWVNDAKYVVTATGTLTAGSYLTPNYNNWLVLTVPADAGVTAGSGGVQELLAYTSNVPVTVPEPASFILIGSGLLIGAVVGRRRIKK